jgi:hypothetical protein
MQRTLFDRINPEPERAELRRQVGMARATAHAEADHEGWSDHAFAFLTRYAAAHDTFMGWQVVQAARDSGAVPEASRKAWGAIFVRAATAGVITKAGYAPDPNRNQNPAPVWQSRLRRKES